jgi:hypothetical protein
MRVGCGGPPRGRDALERLLFSVDAWFRLGRGGDEQQDPGDGVANTDFPVRAGLAGSADNSNAGRGANWRIAKK